MAQTRSESDRAAKPLIGKMEAARLARVHPQTWEALVESGAAPPAVATTGVKRWWRRADIERWLAGEEVARGR